MPSRYTPGRSILHTVAVVLLCGASLSAGADVPPDYENLAPHKAVAVSGPADRPHSRAITQGETQAAAAALNALAQCNRLKPTAAPPCEIVRQNDVDVTPAAAIRANVPSVAHPLYLWRYERPRATLYLAGSMHILKATLHPLPEPFYRALAASELLVTEVDLSRYDPDAAGRMLAQAASLPPTASLDDVLPEALHERLAAHLARNGVNAAAYARMKPAAVATQLAVTQLTAFGYLPEFGMEAALKRRATSHATAGIETLQQQLDVLYGAPLDQQIAMLGDTLEQSGGVEAWLRDTVTAWLSGDDARFTVLFESQSGTSAASRAFMKKVLQDRNATMTSAIAARMQQPINAFILVGAAHLIGPDGIVAALAAKGFHGQRVMSDANRTPAS